MVQQKVPVFAAVRLMVQRMVPAFTAIGFVDWLDRWFIYIYIRRVLKCAFTYDLSLSWGDPITTTTTLPVFQPFLEIREGRHPCIGGSFVGSDFIPNDTVIGIQDVSTWQRVQLWTTALFYLLYLITEILNVKSPSVSHIFIDWLINDHLYSAILRSLEQTNCACMWFYMSD